MASQTAAKRVAVPNYRLVPSDSPARRDRVGQAARSLQQLLIHLSIEFVLPKEMRGIGGLSAL